MRMGYKILYLDESKVIIETNVKKISTKRGAYRYVVQLPKFWIEDKGDNRKVKITIEVLE